MDICEYFNPRPREEGDPQNTRQPNGQEISIHALVKRATTLTCTDWGLLQISIHALVKRATAVEGYVFSSDTISIHALVKRATFGSRCSSYISDFNPRPREEGDLPHLQWADEALYFNPRPREEGDLATPDANTIRSIDFNPRPREEGDLTAFTVG